MTNLKKEFLENALEDKIQNNLDLDKEENIQDEKDKKPQKKKSGFLKRKTKRIGSFFGNTLYPKEGRAFFPTIKKNYSEFLEIFTNKPRTFNDYEEWANYMGIKEDDTEDLLLFTINSKTFITLLITLGFSMDYANKLWETFIDGTIEISIMDPSIVNRKEEALNISRTILSNTAYINDILAEYPSEEGEIAKYTEGKASPFKYYEELHSSQNLRATFTSQQGLHPTMVKPRSARSEE